MKFNRFWLLIGLLIFSTHFTFAQRKLSGKVVEVVDGKTVVIEVSPTKNRFTAELEYIEIPEPEQQLSETVKNHLKELLLGKDVDFVARVLMQTKLVGKVYLGDVDISQQLLRDGAAWYAFLDKDRQEAADRENYQIIEAQAKLEKRGVWSVADLQPAWEFRAEKEKAEKARKEAEEAQRIAVAQPVSSENISEKRTVKPVTKPAAEVTMWADVSGNQEKKYLGMEGLFSGYNAQQQITYLYTGGTFLELGKNADQQKIELRTLYAYKGSTTIERDIYVIGFLSLAKNYKYEKANMLNISVNNKQIYSSKAVRFYAPGQNGMFELLLYKIQRSSLEKIVKANNVKLKIGTTAAGMPQLSHELIEKLLKVTN